MIFGMARDPYRKCKYVVYGSHWIPIGDHTTPCGPKLSYTFLEFHDYDRVITSCYNYMLYRITKRQARKPIDLKSLRLNCSNIT